MIYQFVRTPLRGLRIIPPEQLDRIEEEFGFSFPPVLREYYLELNGCEIKECAFRNDGYEFVVDRMAAVQTGDFELGRLLRQDRENGFIPENLIPLAEALTEGGTYYWDSVTEEIWLTHQESASDFQYVCRGLETFMTILNKSCDLQDEEYLDASPIINQ